MNIDLGQKMDYPETGAMVAISKPPEEKVHYPCIYLRGGPELKAIPESGTVTFRYNRVSQSSRERDDKKTTEVELECHQITDLKPDKEASSKASGLSRGELLDALKSAVVESDDEEGDDDEEGGQE